MTFRELAALAALLVLSGCVDDLDWTLVASGRSSIAGRFLWRNDSELWAFGGATVVRRVDGAWEQLEMCGAGETSVSIEFDGDDVLALCGDGLSRPQQLVRYSGEVGAFVPLPFDGRLVLATMQDGIVVAGETALHRWVGGEWVTIAPAPLTDGGSGTTAWCVGRSQADLYCSGSAGEVVHWNGSAWSPTGIVAYGAPELRAGDVWLGAGRFVDGAYESLAGETERPLTAIAVVPPSTVIWGGGDAEMLYIWRGPAGGGPSEFVGGAPGVASLGPGGTSAGSNRLYAIDAGTFLMINSSTSLSGSGYALWEGR